MEWFQCETPEDLELKEVNYIGELEDDS